MTLTAPTTIACPCGATPPELGLHLVTVHGLARHVAPFTAHRIRDGLALTEQEQEALAHRREGLSLSKRREDSVVIATSGLPDNDALDRAVAGMPPPVVPAPRSRTIPAKASSARASSVGGTPAPTFGPSDVKPLVLDDVPETKAPEPKLDRKEKKPVKPSCGLCRRAAGGKCVRHGGPGSKGGKRGGARKTVVRAKTAPEPVTAKTSDRRSAAEWIAAKVDEEIAALEAEIADLRRARARLVGA